jgi:hypothetical protein
MEFAMSEDPTIKMLEVQSYDELTESLAIPLLLL